MLKSWAKCALKKVPVLMELIRAIVARQRVRVRFGSLCRDVRQKLFEPHFPITVLTGSFQGLLYYDRVVWGILTNKWLGSYEHELSEIIESIIKRGYQRVIDVGCAEGWYLIGLASRMPKTSFYGFDIDPISRWQCRKLAELNFVQKRTQIQSLCSWEHLEHLCGAGAVLICDIEGGEVSLLCPKQSPALLMTDILVEVHEPSEHSSEVSELLKTRFVHSHHIQEVRPVKSVEWAEKNEAIFQGKLSKAELSEAANEHRATGNHWLWMKVKSD